MKKLKIYLTYASCKFLFLCKKSEYLYRKKNILRNFKLMAMFFLLFRIVLLFFKYIY